MSVSRRKDHSTDWDGRLLEAALHVLNAEDTGAIARALASLYLMRGARRARLSRRAEAACIAHAVGEGRAWVEAALVWDRTKASDKRRHRAAIGDALEDVAGGAGYYDTGERFVLVNAEPSAPPHALMALALLPLFDDEAGWRERLGRCAYRNCGRYFVVLTKRSGQGYCRPAHSNLERQYRGRDKKKKAGIIPGG